MRFGEIMLNKGMINESQLEFALKEQEYNLQTVSYSEPIGNILLRNGIINDEQLEKALVEYFTHLSEKMDEPAYVRETAKVAVKALTSTDHKNKLSEEARITLTKKIGENEDKISQYEKSINTLAKLEPKKVILETIDKEKKEIQKLIEKIETLKMDIESFS